MNLVNRLACIAVSGGSLLVACRSPDHPRPSDPLARPMAVYGADAGVAADASGPSPSRPSLVIAQLSTSQPSCGLDTEGRVWSWPNGVMRTEMPSIRGARSIACGPSHACVAAADGVAWCWGSNSYGALGDGTEKNHDDSPVAVEGLSSVAELGVEFGRTCARVTNGEVFCWGDSEFGKAGDGRLPDNVGRQKLLPGKAILAGAATLAVGSAHACSAMPDGRVSCWGQNNRGSCGQPLGVRYVPRPTLVPKLKDVVAVSAGESVTCILDRRGGVACWGSSLYGVLGPNGPADDDSSRSSPVPVPLEASAVEIAVGTGGMHVCARLVTGAIHCWGDNEYGELGDGTRTTRKKPMAVKGIENAIGIGAGLSDTCALVEGGVVFCWGKERMPEGPHGTAEDALLPVQMVIP